MKNLFATPVLAAAIVLTVSACSSTGTAATVTVTKTAEASQKLSSSETCDEVNGYLATIGVSNPVNTHPTGHTEEEVVAAATGLSETAERSRAPFVDSIVGYADSLKALAPYYNDDDGPTEFEVLGEEGVSIQVDAQSVLRDACWNGN